MGKLHQYTLTVKWTGNRGKGTSSYRDYDRSHDIMMAGKPVIQGSSDPAFRGDASCHNPEEMLVATLSSCHMLWFLHLCAEAGVIVTDYVDEPQGTMEQTADGGGQFTSVTLDPQVTVTTEDMANKLPELHRRANELCFIARSVNFPVHHQGSVKVVDRL